jgi:hypothetical protein
LRLQLDLLPLSQFRRQAQFERQGFSRSRNGAGCRQGVEYALIEYARQGCGNLYDGIDICAVAEDWRAGEVIIYNRNEYPGVYTESRCPRVDDGAQRQQAGVVRRQQVRRRKAQPIL